MNKYIVPYYAKNKIGIHTINANSIHECEDKIMSMYEDYTNEYKDFVRECRNRGILLGKIVDVEEL